MKKRLVCGVGINDADYEVQEFMCIVDDNSKKRQKCIWICPFYRKWTAMLVRSYSERYQEKRPNYRGCSVCQEWLTFSNFKAWMEEQDWEGKHLDKDILFPGNRVYSPDTCVFVDARVNTFLTEGNAARGEYMIGVSWSKKNKKFKALCNNGTGKQIYLGYFNEEIEAHKAWLDYKLQLAYQLAEEQTDTRIASALINRYKNYEV